jgi:hypothetical protein
VTRKARRLAVYIIIALLVVPALVLAEMLFFRPSPKPPIIPATPPDISVTQTNSVVKELPLHKGDPLVLRMETPRSKWKAVTIVPLQQGNTQLVPPLIDMGLAYELITVDPPILPEVSLDAVVTPNRYGLGGSIPITEHVDLEAGVSRRWDEGETERYVGVGFHIAW